LETIGQLERQLECEIVRNPATIHKKRKNGIIKVPRNMYGCGRFEITDKLCLA